MLSEKRNSFSELLKNKGLKEEKKAKVGLDAIDTSTTLESNKSLLNYELTEQRERYNLNVLSTLPPPQQAELADLEEQP